MDWEVEGEVMKAITYRMDKNTVLLIAQATMLVS